MKEIVVIIGFAIVSSSIALLQFDNNFASGEDKLLPPEQKSIEIFILSRGFTSGNPHYEPQNVTAKVGTVITWINGDLVHHTVTSDEGIQGKLEGRIFDSGPIPPRREFVLDTSGMLSDVYPYHCTIHPWARGMFTLVVEPISVSTYKSLYNVGEKVTVYGIANIPAMSPDVSHTVPKKLVNATAAKSVSLKVFKPDNELFLSKEVAVLAGRYSYTFSAGEPGTYDVKVALNSFTASTTFQVAELKAAKVTTAAIKFEDARGVSINTAKVGQQVFIRTPIQNALQTSQDYTYIVQIKNADQVTVLLIWKNDSIDPLRLSTPAVAWTPESEGTYSVEIFVWKSMDSPEPLSMHVEKGTLIVRK